MSLLAIIGLLAFVAVVVLLIKSPFSLIAVFTLVPTIASLIAGYSPMEISGFVKLGFSSIIINIIVTAFAIFYFAIMSDVGMFEVIAKPIIGNVGKSKNPVIAIMMAAAIVATIGHMDGAGTTTIMITLPLMMPFFDKMKMDRKALGLAMGIVIGAMNLLPWTGPTRYTGMVLGLDPVEVWRKILPAQIMVLVLGYVLAFLIARREIKRGAVNVLEELPVNQISSDSICAKKKGYFIFNVALTIALLAVLIAGIMDSAYTFMIFTTIALIVNYHDKKTQGKKIKEFSPSILNMVLNVMSVGVFVGIMQEGGFVNALAEAIMSGMPQVIGAHIYLVVGFLCTPLLMMLGTGAYYQGLLPLIVSICTQYGMNPMLVAGVVLIPSGLAVSMSPLVPANHVACGMLGYEMGDLIKYGWKWVVVASWIAVPIAYFTLKMVI